LNVVRSHRRFQSHRLGPGDAEAPTNSDDDDDDQDLDPFWQKLNNDRRNSRARARL